MQLTLPIKDFKAFRIHDPNGKAGVEQVTLNELSDGNVIIRSSYSCINYKDALAATGKGKILRKFPLIGGVDVAGEVAASSDVRFRKGEMVIVTGHGLSEDHDGGYAEYVRVPGDWVDPLPDGMSAFDAMALGSAGFTAAYAILQMERNGQRPEGGEILVNGATGGVGGIAIDLLAGRGYDVVALTGKAEAADHLNSIGAKRVLLCQQLDMGKKPLEKTLWAGAIDNLGGEMLAWLTRTIAPLGNIASIGNAAGPKLETTVMPFILRGVNLLGINWKYQPADIRREIWRRLASDMRPRHLDKLINRVVTLEGMSSVFSALVAGGAMGRTVVKLGAA
jgi:acrylyl-CoA reductase (NADPH)